MSFVHSSQSRPPLTPAPWVSSKEGSDQASHGVRVLTHPSFLAEQSDPQQSKYAWAYRIRIVNQSERTVKLLRRHWTIVDGDGERNDVRGDGVVGHQPVLKPGEDFEYTSYCPLASPWGTMEGEYTFIDMDGGEFEVKIGRFFLVSPHV